MSEKRSLFVRALFDFEPSRDEDVPSRGNRLARSNIFFVKTTAYLIFFTFFQYRFGIFFWGYFVCN